MIQPRVRLVILNQDKILLEHTPEEDYYFYPGGKVEQFETLTQTAIREIQEELATNFTSIKLLYISEYIDQSIQNHSLEFFFLGTIDPLTDHQNPHNPDPKPHTYKWFSISELPSNLLPAALTPILQQDFQSGFPNQAQYLGQL